MRRFIDELADNHPPLQLGDADLTVRDPEAVSDRYGEVFQYLARVEHEVERNVLELRALLPRAGEIDRTFFEEVWSPQEVQHGVLLDAVQDQLGLPPAVANLDRVSVKIKALGVLAHIPHVHDVVRQLYYLTGAATERSAVMAYGRLHDGLERMSERAISQTVISPIRRQEPGHFAFYRLSAEAMVRNTLQPWQLHLVRCLRSTSFELVGVNNSSQRAQFGRVARDLDLDQDLAGVVRQIARVEWELLWARKEGMDVPPYVLRAIARAIDDADFDG